MFLYNPNNVFSRSLFFDLKNRVLMSQIGYAYFILWIKLQEWSFLLHGWFPINANLWNYHESGSVDMVVYVEIVFWDNKDKMDISIALVSSNGKERRSGLSLCFLDMHEKLCSWKIT